MYYIASQNNVRGHHIQNNTVDVYVIVEANNYETASDKMTNILSEYDDYCQCCGSRWYGIDYEVSDLSQITNNDEVNAIVYNVNGEVTKISIDSRKIWDYSI